MTSFLRLTYYTTLAFQKEFFVSGKTFPRTVKHRKEMGFNDQIK